ncbi:hypothetical protein BT93_L1159 [Corymbia citriodora subsp. variegata]|uniref:Calcium-transporting ATPase n=1 Tax=Corymbia citriodora subsp. variegata TaxID=360336 RepID=A0A8T0CQX9_CORYI|nr:hypothetical protein BT93_L1159 [Corymbia citriodora subsp. variegata]
MGGVTGVASALGTDMEKGISGDAEDVHLRVKKFGHNLSMRRPKRHFLSSMRDASIGVVLVILLVCAAFLLGFGIKKDGFVEGWYHGGSILFAEFAVIMVFATFKFWQYKQFDWLCRENDIQVEVIRSGRRQKISIFKIVVGDVVYLDSGDKVPADGLFLDGQSLQIDELSMTGESRYVEVDSDRPFLFSGSTVVDGYGRMLAIAVGMNLTWGKMMSSISLDSSKQTPLQARLKKLTSLIGIVGLVVAFLVFLAMLIQYSLGKTQDEKGNRDFIAGKTWGNDIVNMVEIIAAAVTIGVVMTPKGLMLAVEFSLAYSMKRMMVDQAMVRKLSACETMGSTATICTGKTGILTMSQMKVTKFWVGQDSMVESACPSASKHVLDLILDGVALNSTGSIYRPSLGSEYEFSGGPTEKAILSWAVSQLSMDMEETKKSCEVIQVEAFNSQIKRSGVLIRKSAGNTIHVHWKGAAEMVLAMCSSFYNKSGIVKDLDEDERVRFEQIIQEMAVSSLGCIAFAHKQVSEEAIQEREDGKKIQEDGLTLLGLVGIKDPCRPGVKSAVQACQDAGVNIKMITGDNIFTAKAIAMECGILKPGDDAFNGAIVEGIEFRSYTPEERLRMAEKIRVMARSLPSDKFLMVQCLKQIGHVVAVIGDGRNNASALKEADIGLSMGIQGTSVAKESSDIVILDDNFASVATVLQWGRCTYNNIRKLLQFQLTWKVTVLVVSFVVAVSSGDVPLTAVQLLWVKLIMDVLGTLGLAAEWPTRELMKKPPIGRTDPLITNVMWKNLLAQAMYQIAILLTLQFKGEAILGVDEAVKRTLIFNAFVLCQVFNGFNARKLEKKNVFEGIHENKLFLGVVCMTVVLQVAMVDFLKRFTGMEPLSWGQWGTCIAIAAVSWPVGWVVKCIPVPGTPIFNLF